jgi:hypothetical protein
MADTGSIDRKRLTDSEGGSTGSEITQSSSLTRRPTPSTAHAGSNRFGAMADTSAYRYFPSLPSSPPPTDVFAVESLCDGTFVFHKDRAVLRD